MGKGSSPKDYSRPMTEFEKQFHQKRKKKVNPNKNSNHFKNERQYSEDFLNSLFDIK